jgi:hypothetical protein
LGRPKKQTNQVNDIKSETTKIETISSQPLSKEELDFQKLIASNFAQLTKLIRRDLNGNKQAQTFFNKNFDRDKVQEWLGNPQKFERNLRHLVRFLFISSSHFRRATLYFATLPMWKYTVEMYGCLDFDELDPKNVKKKYLETLNYLEVMNLEHEFSKISLICWLEDTFFGYEYRLKDSYLIQPLDPDYCQISGSEDGVLTFKFDFSYFRTREEELERIDPEFKEKYELYKQDTRKNRWQELNSEKAVCLKVNENFDFSIPPLSGILTSLYDIEDFKQLKKAKVELENYMILGFTIPYQKNAENTENAFALSLDKALEFYNMAVAQLPDQVGALLSPFDKIESVRVDKNDKTVDTVEEAENAFYNDAGISKMLFNSSANGASLTKSIEIDETIMFKFIKQGERWINKKLKGFCKKVLFRSHFLEMTYMSRDAYIKNVKEGAMSGVPVKNRYAAALGLSPSATAHNEYLENIVLDIPNKWIPLKTSYTQSDKKGGRTPNADDNLSPEGETTRSNDANNPDNRDY